MAEKTDLPVTLKVTSRLAGAAAARGDAPLAGATWYVAEDVGDGVEFRCPKGAMRHARWLWLDLLLDGVYLAAFRLSVSEAGRHGATFTLSFGLLNQCSARLRLPLSAVDQNRWKLAREGALLQPKCGGDAVDLSRVNRVRLVLNRESPTEVRWCLTPLTVTAEEPPPLERPVLPRGPLLDALGQSTIHDWPGRTPDEATLVARLRRQHDEAEAGRWPNGFSRWGGRRAQSLDATGFFHTRHDGDRWWLVDPDGHPFWSAGIDCVRPQITSPVTGLTAALDWSPLEDERYAETVDHPGGRPIVNLLGVNFIRAFGAEWQTAWSRIALAQLRQFGFNTVGNWSRWETASAAKFPYVRPLPLRFEHTPPIFRDMPDVFDPRFDADAQAFAEALRPTADDPAMIGYFLMNEPQWGFAKLPPAAGMLISCDQAHSRTELARWLQERYGTPEKLAKAWKRPGLTFEQVAAGRWDAAPKAALDDLEQFSTRMVRRFFDALSEACRQVDPHHLNLGARYHTTPPPWALEGMASFDVFSINAYRQRLDDKAVADLAAATGRPVLVGEWHFGALDVGLPASGIGHVPDQASRGKAYRVYFEHAAVHPACVGVHWFTLYDQSALGREDGENYNIGFLDICHRPYEPLANAARLSHERLYDLIAGKLKPYQDEPKYLPRLFL